MWFRLVILMLIIGIIPVVVIRETILSGNELRAVSARSDNLLGSTKRVAGDIGKSGFFDSGYDLVIEGEITQLADFYEGRAFVVNTEHKIIFDTQGGNEDMVREYISPEYTKALKGSPEVVTDTNGGRVICACPIKVKDSKEETAIKGVLVVAGSLDRVLLDTKEARDKTLIYLVCICLVVVLLILLTAFWYMIPMRNFKREALNFAEGYEDELKDVGGYAELSEITGALNEAVARFKRQDESRDEFVSNVSHELKTPITSMKVLADSLLAQPEVPSELYREFLSDIAREIDRENNIITNLLTLVRLDNKEMFEVKSVNINDLLEFILKTLRPIATQRNIELMMESFRPVIAEVDEAKLNTALTNLIENGVKYNKEGGYVHVTLNADHQYFYVRIEDSGIGIPESELENVFERFYRVDKSHSKEISGTGLGLAIVKNIILLHRGSIKVNSTPGEGSTFNVMIPLTYVK